MSTRPRRLRRLLVVIALTLLVLIGGAVVFLRVQFSGPALAESLEGMLNETMRGRISVRSIDWPTSDVTKVVTGGWVPFTLEDVDVYDADDQHILHVEKITCELDIHALMFGNHDLVFRNVVLDSGWAILEEIPEPYPLHAYDQTVISLFAAFYGERKPGFRLGAVAESPPVFDIRDVQLRDVDLYILFTPEIETRKGAPPLTTYAFTAEIHDVDGGGFLFTDPSDPLVPKVYFSLPSGAEPIRGDSAVVRLFDPCRPDPTQADKRAGCGSPEYTFTLDSLEMSRFAQLPSDWPRDMVANNLEFVINATSREGAAVAIDGAMLDYWDSPYGGEFKIQMGITNAGPMATASIDPDMGGDDLIIDASVTGPILFPKVQVQMRGLEYTVELREEKDKLNLYLDNLDVDLDLATETGQLHEAVGRVLQDGRDGEVKLGASFGLSPYYVDADIEITHPIDLAYWLPDEVNRAFGSDVHGKLRARGDSALTLQVDGLDLHLGRLHVPGGTLYAKDEFSLFEMQRLRLDAGATSVTVDGRFESGPERFELELDVDSGDLDAWLRRFGMPAFATRARGRGIRARGTLDEPTAAGTIALGGVPVIDDLDTTFTYGGTELTIERARSTTVGDVRARGTIDLAGAPSAERIRITGRSVDLGKLPGIGPMSSGKVDVDVVADGPLGPDLRVDATVKSDDVTFLGQKVSRLRACLNHDPDDPICAEAAALSPEEARACTDDARRDGKCLLAGITRADGGSATLVARTDAADRLDGRLAIDALPIDAVAGLAGTGKIPAGGTARIELDLGGTLAAPTAEGTMSTLRAWLFGAYLGDERFRVRFASSDDPRVECDPDRPEPSRASGRLAVCGELEDGRVVVAAVLGTSGTFPVRAAIDLRRVEIDPFIDLGEALGTPTPVRAWASGTVTVETELMREDAPLDVRLELPELALMVPRVDADGRPAPLVFSTKEGTPLSVRFDGTDVSLNRPVTFQTPAGELTVAGKATRDVLDLTVAGLLDLEDLQPFLATWFDHSEGRVTVDGTVTGTFAAPEIAASVALEDIVLRPAGQDTELRIDDARLDHSPDRGLSLTSLAVEVATPSGGRSVLTAHGGIKLDGITPVLYGVIVEGDLSAEMLLAFAPEALAQASGTAELYLSVTGPGDAPIIEGDLSFDARRPFALMPRGLRREIILTGGRIEFTEELVVLDNVSGSLDDEGKLSRVNGEIVLADGAPAAGDITLSADGIPFRVPRTLDLVISVSKLGLRWGDDVDGDGYPDMEVDGTVEIVQGRYIRAFRFDEFLRPAESSGGPTKPFWEEYPMLGNADLRLDIEARSLSVENNIANVELAGEVRLLGTPRDPRVEGEISVLRGTFKPQFTRARFTRTSGSVSFSRFARFPDDTPTLDISSEADYRDSTGQDHLISLSLAGPLSRLTWDLTTSSGLNKSQTLTLIVAGRAPEDATARNAGDPVTADPTQVDPSTNPTDSAADQILKDFAGDFISLLVADPLKDVEIFDVARVEVGTGSIGFHGERKVYSNTNVVGDLEQTVRGRTLNVRMEIKSTFGLTLQLGLLNKDYDDPAEEDVTDREAKLVYRWFIP